jgi:hypothetical protein
MALNFRRQQMMERLGIRQAPTVNAMAESITHHNKDPEILFRTIPVSYFGSCNIAVSHSSLPQLSGQKCSECEENGQHSWVQSGQDCNLCAPSMGPSAPHPDCEKPPKGEPTGNDITVCTLPVGQTVLFCLRIE